MSTSTTLHSNAFNFMSFIQGQVDPRTGQYTGAITLPELMANQLSGPVVPLQLSFNALNVQDSGFGKGWNLQLSQFDPGSGALSLHTGETFTVKVSLDGTELTIPEKKIDSFHFYKLGDKRYRIDHKSGLIEILEVGQGEIAMPVQMLSPQGHSVTLEYVAFGTDPLL
ncbi:sugar-binding protein, partial [Pseudomonas lundensis]|nr:sugar-binding protein [Pseudomonas lundensis]